MAHYYIGTAGWSYEDWKGIVYPQEKEAGFHPLVYLARYINIVEINSTFYRPPVLSMSLFWLKRVAGTAEFLFAVKAHQVFTHDRENFSQKDVDEFRLGIEPLQAKGRLACLLFQFPWSFSSSSANFDHLARLFQLFQGLPLAVEVRHSSWAQPDFYELLSTHRVAYCNIDQPVVGNSIRPSAIATVPEFAYVRLHGRNYQNWFREGAGRDERYNYLYTQQELEEWVERIKTLGEKANRVFVITNNHYRGQALANALQIKNMVTGEKLDVPPPLLRHYPVLAEIARKLGRPQLDLFDKEKTGKSS
ncbi:MAG: DUF72 domain-containing protein [Candidatus Aminicenantales bacterium]